MPQPPGFSRQKDVQSSARPPTTPNGCSWPADAPSNDPTSVPSDDPVRRQWSDPVADGLTVSDYLMVNRQSMMDISQLLASQSALQQELELRWSTVVKRDEAIVPFPAKPDATDQNSGEKANPIGGQEDGVQGSDFPKNEELPRKNVEIDVIVESIAPATQDLSRQTSPMQGSEPEGPTASESASAAQIRTSMSAVALLAEGLERERVLQEQQKQAAKEHCFVEFIRSDKFDLLVGLVIIFNTLVMLTHVELSGIYIREHLFDECPGGACSAGEGEHEHVFKVMEHGFTAIFLLELIVRLLVHGFHYLKNAMHIGDTLIVLISVIDNWVLNVMLGSSTSSGTSILRIARLCKLGKVFRVVRVLRAFKPLRILVNTIAHSVSALVWSMSLLFVLEIIGSIFIAQLVHSFISDNDNDLMLRRRVWERFGTWSRSMLSTYEMTMAPGGFIQYRDIMEEVSPLVTVFFIVYGCTVTFAVIRVITALFLRATLSACDADDHQQAILTTKLRHEFAERLKTTIDVDGSGGVNSDELEILMHIPEMREWVFDVGLSLPGVKRIYRALQQGDDGNGEMNFDTFLDALSQMTGQARSCDLMIVSYETQKSLSHTEMLLQHLTSHISVIESHIGVTSRELQNSGLQETRAAAMDMGGTDMARMEARSERLLLQE